MISQANPRQGAYPPAQLADECGSEITLQYLIEALAADCNLRSSAAYFLNVISTSLISRRSW